MSKIKFYGTAGMVTGSSYLLTGENGSEILIDLGMFQEEELSTLNTSPFDFNVSNLSGALITHAHLDHCGRLPLLIKNGFRKKIYMTEATKMLVELSLLDSARLAEEDKNSPPLYTEEDVAQTMKMVETVVYDEKFEIEDFEIIFRDAGHILGSASIEIKTGEKQIVFSGDLGNSPSDLVKPTEEINNAGTVIIESTYGGKDHPKEDASEIIAEEINKVENSGGVLLIPAFSIERSQQILHMIDHLKKTGKVKENTPVFLDSPMAIKATGIFKRYKNLLNSEITLHDDDPFDFPGLSLTQEPFESKKILKIDGPKVIIAGSGMMNGGRILHHAANYLSKTTTRLLFVGFLAKGTLGRRIADGAKTIQIFDREIKINASIGYVHSLSSHADQSMLLKWLKNINGVRQLFIIHGEEEARKILSEKVKNELKINQIFLPEMNQEFEV